MFSLVMSLCMIQADGCRNITVQKNLTAGECLEARKDFPLVSSDEKKAIVVLVCKEKKVK